MGSLADTPTWRPEISQAPRASLTIRMDAEHEGAIPLTELADIARHVQAAVDQIARALNDRESGGRPPEFLRKLSTLEAVGIGAGSVVLEMEAPHDMMELPIEVSDADAGVQAIELFVQSTDALSQGMEPPEQIGRPAVRSLRAFARAVSNHEEVKVESTVRGVTKNASFVPRLVLAETVIPDAEVQERSSVEIVGTLYEVNLDRHQYRVRDELGTVKYVSLGEEMDVQALARSLLGEVVRVTAAPMKEAGGGEEHFAAESIERVAPPRSEEYYAWDLEAALARVEPLESIHDLAIPGLDGDEFDSFWRAVND